ncbi:MAG: pyridoxal phosphate-dependent aminotransferase [Acidobacteria bacterium]|nr:pyridoxal phosphate-dependent aminotransferase [Acidobacteriota bacterium]MCA1650996.1 pyridoxal phosphate-dependent aminotransferase [Acidobacteriota bacterium]
MFSPRVPVDRQPNRLAAAAARARSEKRTLIDLTVTNPTVVGIEYPPRLLEALAGPAARIYEPVPLGLPAAREAVARDYARRGRDVPPAQIVLTASTSEAYSLLFKLLCRPSGDAVMVPVPSYPLFDHLTRLDGVEPVPYRLEYHGRWQADLASVDNQWSDRVRAVLAVSPNNPTGSLLTCSELDALDERCAAAGATLIIDEVFADYPLHPGEDRGGPAAHAPRSFNALTFHLGGLSKSAGLPQVKLGWMAVEGPDALVREALDRLELICDTYLSVSTPVQAAARSLIEVGETVRPQILARVTANYNALASQVSQHSAVELLHADAGWSAVCRVPSTQSEEELVLALMEQDSVLLHPGFFFDFPHEAFLVVSLLPGPDEFLHGIRCVMERAGG